MKKLLLLILFLFVLVGCNIQESEETFTVFDELIYLNENEGMLIPIDYSGIDEERINITFSNDSILEFDEKELSIKAKKIGFTKIIIEVLDSEFSASIDVYVEAKEIVAPVMIPSNNIIKEGESLAFFITNSAKVGAAIESFNLTLNDDELAEIDDNYIIKTKKPGNLIVTATHKTKPEISSSFEVTIKDKNYNDKYTISTENNLFKVKPGEYLDLYVDGNRINMEEDYYFTSSTNMIANNSNASVTADGRVVGIKNGIVYIGVKNKITNKSGTIYLQVEGDTNQVDYINRLIDIALSEDGYRENSTNAWTKFGEWYDPHYALLDWCAMFVAYSANEAGIPTTVIPRLAKVEFMRDFYVKANRYEKRESGYTPKAGDIIIFKDTSHVGIVLYSKDGRVHTIEGNTSKMVAERNYSLTDTYILGYGIPDYEKLNF